MQLSELSESINVSHFAPAIKQAIIDGIFYSIVNVENSINTINTGTYTPDTIKLHHSSPQEVGAIVNELVIDAISETGLDDDFSEYSNPLKVLNTYVKEINPNLIDNIIKQRLSYFDKKDPIENKIRQRYIKLTYQGIQHYISNLYKQVKNMEANK